MWNDTDRGLSGLGQGISNALNVMMPQMMASRRQTEELSAEEALRMKLAQVSAANALSLADKEIAGREKIAGMQSRADSGPQWAGQANRNIGNIMDSLNKQLALATASGDQIAIDSIQKNIDDARSMSHNILGGISSKSGLFGLQDAFPGYPIKSRKNQPSLQ